VFVHLAHCLCCLKNEVVYESGMLRMKEVPTPDMESSAGGTSEATNSPTGEGGLQHGQVQPSSGTSGPLSHMKHLGGGAQRQHGLVQDPWRHEREERSTETKSSTRTTTR
jgi:hypothetical protein